MPHLTREEIIAFTQRVTKDMEFLNAALEEGIEDAATADWLKTEYQSLSYSLRKAMQNIKEDAECIEKSVVTLDDEDNGFIASSSTMSQASSSSGLAGVNFTGSPVPKQFPTPRFESRSPPPRRTLPVIYESVLPERLPTSMSPIHEGKRKRTGELFSFNVPARRTIRSPPSPIHATNSNRISPLALPWGPGRTTPGHISNSPNYASPAPGPRSPNAGSPSHSSQGSPFSTLLPPRHSVFSPSLHESPPSQTQEEENLHSSVGNEPNTFVHMPAPRRPMPSLNHSVGFKLDSAVSSSSRPVHALVPEASKRCAALPFSGSRGRGATPSPVSTRSAFRSFTPPTHPSAAASEPQRRDPRSYSLASETSSPPPSADNKPSDRATNHAAEVDLLLQQDEKARRERKIVAERLEREAVLRRLHDDGGLRVEPEDDDKVEFIMERTREASLDDGLKSDGTTMGEGAQERKRKAQPSSSERTPVRRRYV